MSLSQNPIQTDPNQRIDLLDQCEDEIFQLIKHHDLKPYKDLLFLHQSTNNIFKEYLYQYSVALKQSIDLGYQISDLQADNINTTQLIESNYKVRIERIRENKQAKQQEMISIYQKQKEMSNPKIPIIIKMFKDELTNPYSNCLNACPIQSAYQNTFYVQKFLNLCANELNTREIKTVTIYKSSAFKQYAALFDQELVDEKEFQNSLEKIKVEEQNQLIEASTERDEELKSSQSYMSALLDDNNYQMAKILLEIDELAAKLKQSIEESDAKSSGIFQAIGKCTANDDFFTLSNLLKLNDDISEIRKKLYQERDSIDSLLIKSAKRSSKPISQQVLTKQSHLFEDDTEKEIKKQSWMPSDYDNFNYTGLNNWWPKTFSVIPFHLRTVAYDPYTKERPCFPFRFQDVDLVFGSVKCPKPNSPQYQKIPKKLNNTKARLFLNQPNLGPPLNDFAPPEEEARTENKIISRKQPHRISFDDTPEDDETKLVPAPSQFAISSHLVLKSHPKNQLQAAPAPEFFPSKLLNPSPNSSSDPRPEITLKSPKDNPNSRGHNRNRPANPRISSDSFKASQKKSLDIKINKRDPMEKIHITKLNVEPPKQAPLIINTKPLIKVEPPKTHQRNITTIFSSNSDFSDSSPPITADLDWGSEDYCRTASLSDDSVNDPLFNDAEIDAAINSMEFVDDFPNKTNPTSSQLSFQSVHEISNLTFEKPKVLEIKLKSEEEVKIKEVKRDNNPKEIVFMKNNKVLNIELNSHQNQNHKSEENEKNKIKVDLPQKKEPLKTIKVYTDDENIEEFYEFYEPSGIGCEVL